MAGLFKEKVFYLQVGWGWFLIQLLFANLLLSYFLVSFSGNWETWQQLTTGAQIVRLILLVTGGVITYFGGLFCCGLRWRQIYR